MEERGRPVEGQGYEIEEGVCFRYRRLGLWSELTGDLDVQKTGLKATNLQFVRCIRALG